MLMDCFDFCSILPPVQSQPSGISSVNHGPHGVAGPGPNHHRSGLMNTTGETTVSAGPDPDSDEQQEVIEVQILPQVS